MMKTKRKRVGTLLVLALLSTIHSPLSTARAFEGRIHATLTRGGEVETLRYTVGTNCLRVARGETNWPYTVTLVHRDSGAVTLLFPNNRSFVQLKPAAANASAPRPGAPAMPPPSLPAVDGKMPAMPRMPMMPMPGESVELTATTDTTNLLGYACTRYELKQRGEVMEIWATDKLLPYQAWMQNQPPRFGPRMIEEQWGGLLRAKKLFPLLAILKFENGPERLRFEVKAITPQKLTAEEMKLFQPPAGWFEIQPLPF